MGATKIEEFREKGFLRARTDFIQGFDCLYLIYCLLESKDNF